MSVHPVQRKRFWHGRQAPRLPHQPVGTPEGVELAELRLGELLELGEQEIRRQVDEDTEGHD